MYAYMYAYIYIYIYIYIYRGRAPAGRAARAPPSRGGTRVASPGQRKLWPISVYILVMFLFMPRLMFNVEITNNVLYGLIVVVLAY